MPTESVQHLVNAASEKAPYVPTAQPTVEFIVSWLRLGVEGVGAVIIAAGVLVALSQILRSMLSAKSANFNAIRLLLARYLALALEFQLAADILSTAIAPSPQEIGKLGAIAIIRTGLNYFLSKEMREERQTVEGEHNVQRDASA